MENNQAKQDIIEILEKVSYGEVNFSVCKHNGKIHNVIANEFKTYKYSQSDPNANSSAVAQLIQLMKAMSQSKESGATSFTVTFHKGSITKMVLAGYENKNYVGKDNNVPIK